MNETNRNRQSIGDLLIFDGWSAAVADSVAGLALTERGRIAGWRDVIESLGPEAVAERRQRTLARIAGGIGAWNHWAEQIASLAGNASANGPMRAIVAAISAADLQDAQILHSLDLAGFKFPGVARFDGTRFAREVYLQGSKFLDDVTFRSVRFEGDAYFDGAVFGPVSFERAVFLETAHFRGASFDALAGFEQTRFNKPAWFRGSIFSALAEFRQAHFAEDAAFGSCRFNNDAVFNGTQFCGHAGFDHADFASHATFEHAVFGGAAWFSDATFAAAPNFMATRFAGATHFDRVMVPLGDNGVKRQLDELQRRLASG